MAQIDHPSCPLFVDDPFGKAEHYIVTCSSCAAYSLESGKHPRDLRDQLTVFPFSTDRKRNRVDATVSRLQSNLQRASSWQPPVGQVVRRMLLARTGKPARVLSQRRNATYGVPWTSRALPATDAGFPPRHRAGPRAASALMHISGAAAGTASPCFPHSSKDWPSGGVRHFL